MDRRTRAQDLLAQSEKIRSESRRLIALARELVHDAGNLLLQGQMRRLKAGRLRGGAPNRVRRAA